VQCNNTLDCLAAAQSEGEQWVCAADNFCAPLGCSTDAQCAILASGSTTARIRMFCTEPPVLEGTVIQSAITD
jgi:hypothetical protein